MATYEIIWLWPLNDLLADWKIDKGEHRCSTDAVGPDCQLSRCLQGLLLIQAMGMMGDIHGSTVFANHI